MADREDMREDGGLMERLSKLLRMKRADVPEEVSKKMPEAVMPRKAVEKKREQLRKLDEQTKAE